MILAGRLGDGFSVVLAMSKEKGYVRIRNLPSISDALAQCSIVIYCAIGVLNPSPYT